MTSRLRRKAHQGCAQVKGNIAIAHSLLVRSRRPPCRMSVTGEAWCSASVHLSRFVGLKQKDMKACALRSRYVMVIEVSSFTSPSLSGPGSSSEASSAAAAAAAAAAAWRLRRPA